MKLYMHMYCPSYIIVQEINTIQSYGNSSFILHVHVHVHVVASMTSVANMNMYMYVASYPVSTASYFLHVGSGNWVRGFMWQSCVEME